MFCLNPGVAQLACFVMRDFPEYRKQHLYEITHRFKLYQVVCLLSDLFLKAQVELAKHRLSLLLLKLIEKWKKALSCSLIILNKEDQPPVK